MYNSIANPLLDMRQQSKSRPLTREAQSKTSSVSPPDFFTLRHIPRKIKNSSIQTSPTINLKAIEVNLETAPNTPKRRDMSSQADRRPNKENKLGSVQCKGLQFKEPRPLRRRKMSYNFSRLDLSLSHPSETSQTVCELGELRSEMLGLLSEEANESIRSTVDVEKYRVLQKLGEGSFSQVYCVKELATGKVYAMKVISGEILEQNMDRIQQEIGIHASLDHPNIIQLYHILQEPGRLVLIQEFAGKNTLYDLMNSQQTIPIDTASRILSQLCEAVRYMHSQHLMHRDIKPENIIVGQDGTVKLIDFGWSVRCLPGQTRNTLCGTPLYLSPELLLGGEYDMSVDLWAIGVIAFEMITGKSPFGIESVSQLSNIVKEEPQLDNVLHESAQAFIKMLLQKNSSHRKSIHEVCQHPFLSTQGSLTECYQHL